jgi:hypothetical protein
LRWTAAVASRTCSAGLCEDVGGMRGSCVPRSAVRRRPTGRTNDLRTPIPDAEPERGLAHWDDAVSVSAEYDLRRVRAAKPISTFDNQHPGPKSHVATAQDLRTSSRTRSAAGLQSDRTRDPRAAIQGYLTQPLHGGGGSCRGEGVEHVQRGSSLAIADRSYSFVLRHAGAA